AAARPSDGHLECLHIRIGAGEAAVYTPHVGFAGGAALTDALQDLRSRADSRSFLAAENFDQFCVRSGITIAHKPSSSCGVTACWNHEENDAVERILFRARHSDLVVTGRSRKPNGLPADFLPQLLLGCGRPVLIAGENGPSNLCGTVMVCWRETPDAARAVM